jgi:hypothetical protein
MVVELERDESSPLWRAGHPPRFFVEVGGAFAISPSLGGEIVADCSGSCKTTTPLGFAAVAHVGYQLSSGLGFGVDGGYFRLVQKVRDRSISIHPQGLPDNPGTADDTLALRGLLVGASVQFHRGETVPLLLRVGAGALLGSVNDARIGSGTTLTRTINGVTYAAMPYEFSTVESDAARYLYVAPEARLGLRFGDHFEVSAGVEVLVLIALGQPTWQDSSPVVLPTEYHAGQLTFGTQSVASSTLVAFAPGLGARYEF